MRKELMKLGTNRRYSFTGTFERTGWKSGYKGPLETVLLTNIKLADGTVVTDHLWFNYTKGFRDANLNAGDIVAFDARVCGYTKGYQGNRYRYENYWDFPEICYDYKLDRPTKIIKIVHE